MNKEQIFEMVWDSYWWKKRNFSYRVTHNEEEEKKVLAEMFDTFVTILESNSSFKLKEGKDE